MATNSSNNNQDSGHREGPQNNAPSSQQTGNDKEGYSNAEKDPAEWVTGGEPMTGAQRSYLKTLSDEAGEELDENLNKAEASIKIDALQHKTGRGLDDNNDQK